MLTAASFTQVSATHESRVAPLSSYTLPFLFRWCFQSRSSAGAEGKERLQAGDPRASGRDLWQNCHCRLRRRGPRGQGRLSTLPKVGQT